MNLMANLDQGTEKKYRYPANLTNRNNCLMNGNPVTRQQKPTAGQAELRTVPEACSLPP